ncbi:MAG: tetratricopeptide repeat protein, partial [Gammaproteobacteria bacterium]
MKPVTIMKKSLFPVLLAIVMSTGCTSFERRVTQSAEAMNSWANNDYVSCVNKSRNVIALALEEQTDHFRARALLGWCELALGHLDEAETAFDELGRLSPANFEAMLGSAWVKLARRQLTQAEIALKESARWASGAYLSPQQSAEGWLAFYQGKLDLAEERFRAAERDLFHENYTTTHVDHGVKRNWSTQPWVGLGWVEMYRGRPEASRKAFLKGLDRDPNCHDCYGGLARLYMGLGQRTQAFKFATKGLSLT